MWNVLDTALKRSDLIIMTGGLGPTKDDLTKEVAASFFGKKLVFHEQTYEHVRKRLESYGISEMTESQKKQALVPEGALIVTNPAGLARLRRPCRIFPHSRAADAGFRRYPPAQRRT